MADGLLAVVAIGIAEADDPNAEWISNEDTQEMLEERLARLLKRARESKK